MADSARKYRALLVLDQRLLENAGERLEEILLGAGQAVKELCLRQRTAMASWR
jgi:hypothetical protein